MTQQVEPINDAVVTRGRDVRLPDRYRSIESALGLVDDRADPALERAFDVPTVADTLEVRPLSVGVVGLGYVGLTTGLAFMERHASVIGYDRSEARLGHIAAASDALTEDERMRIVRSRDRLRLVEHPLAPALTEADAILICVPTPVDEHQVPDLEPLRTACEQVVIGARRGQIILLTSTTYVGCTRDLLVGPLEARGLVVGEDVFVAFTPERVDPGNRRFPQELVPRIVGGVTHECTARAAEVIREVAAAIKTVDSPEAAELAKLFENTFRAVNIALANELADIAAPLHLDVMEVIDAAATKPYGFMPFFPGPGVGGHCIPVDPHYLLWQLKAHRVGAPLIERAMTLISSRPGRVVQRAAEMLADAGKPVAGSRVVVVGVAYKPGVPDVRSSPALEILAGLRARGARVEFFDPHVAEVRIGDAVLHSTTAISQDADLVVLHTAHGSAEELALAECPLVLDLTYRSVAGLRVGTL